LVHIADDCYRPITGKKLDQILFSSVKVLIFVDNDVVECRSRFACGVVSQITKRLRDKLTDSMARWNRSQLIKAA
jgi:hypothetical protein